MKSSDIRAIAAVGLFVFGLGVFLFDDAGIYPEVWGVTMCYKAFGLL